MPGATHRMEARIAAQPHAHRALNVAAVAVMALAVAGLLATPTPPLTDYPSWLAEARLFGSDDTGFHVVAAPNAASIVPVAVLSWILPIELAGRLVLCLAMVALVVSAQMLSRATFGSVRPGWAVALLYLYAAPLLQGAVGFALTVPLIPLALATALWAWPTRAPSRWLALAAVLTVALAAHALAFGLALVAIAGLAVGWPSRGASLRAGLAVAPGLGLGLAYGVLRDAPAGTWWPEWHLADRGRMLVRGLLPVGSFEPFAHPLPVSVVSLAVLAAVAALLVSVPARHGPRALWPAAGPQRAAWVAGLFLLAAAAVLPDRWLELHGAPGRAVLAAVLVLGVALAPSRVPRWEHALVAAVAGAVIAVDVLGFASVQGPVTRCRALAARAPADAAVLWAPGLANAGPSRRMAVPVHPLRHVHAWRVVDGGAPSCALFPTSLVQVDDCVRPYPVARGADPAALAGSVRAAMATLDTHAALITGLPSELEALAVELGPPRLSAPGCALFESSPASAP